MPTARRVIPYKAALPTTKNIAVTFTSSGGSPFDLWQMQSDGEHVMVTSRGGYTYLLDGDLNLMYQRRVDNTDGADYGGWGASTTSTFSAGTNYLSGITYVSNAWKSWIAEFDNMFAVSPTRQIRYTMPAGSGINISQVVVVNGNVFAFFMLRAGGYVVIKYDNTLTQVARYDSDGVPNSIMGMIVDESGIYIETSQNNYQITISKLDLNLSPVGRVDMPYTTFLFSRPVNVCILNGYVYAGAISRNPTFNQYDAALYKVSTDLSSYEVVRADVTNVVANSSLYLGTFATTVGTLIWMGAVYRSGAYRLRFYEFDQNLNILNQFGDANSNANYDNESSKVAAVVEANSIIVDSLSAGGVHHVVRLDDRDFPVKTEAACDNHFGWLNSNDAFVKGSGTPTNRSISSGTRTFTEEASSIVSPTVNDSLSAQCEFSPT